MGKIMCVYDAWKAGILDKFLAGADGSDHSSPAILNILTPVNWVTMTRSVWGTYDELDEKEKTQFASDFEKALTNLINGSLYDIWAAAYILSMQIPYQEGKDKKAPFSIDLSVNNLFWHTVQERQSELKQYYPEGPRDLNAYNDILRLDEILLEDYGISYSSICDKK